MKASTKKILTAYGIYLLILGFLALVFLLYARKTLVLYEASQPHYVMDELITNPELLTMLDTSNLAFNEFETEESYYQNVLESISANRIQYYLLKESYTDGSLTYGLYAGDLPFGTIVLIPQNTVTKMIAIPITDWVVSDMNAYEASESYHLTVTVPDSYQITINGIVLNDNYVSEVAEYPELSYCAEYVTVPEQLTYEVTGLKHPFNLIITDANGEILISDTQTNTQNEYQFTPACQEMDEELAEMVLSGVETYSNFFSKDLPGCRESIDPIRHLFPEDSIYLSLADQYRREDMGVFASHSNTHFLNESISEYIPYNENCFSCRVYFDKSMTLGSSREIIDTTDNRYFFVRIDGNWVIADIQ